VEELVTKRLYSRPSLNRVNTNDDLLRLMPAASTGEKLKLSVCALIINAKNSQKKPINNLHG
jgi:hypothetical protein